MGCSYELTGSVRVKKEFHTQVEEIVDRFNDESTDDLAAEYDDEVGVVEFSGLVYGSYTFVSDLEDIVQELSPHVAEPTFLSYVCDGEQGQLYIGPEELEQEAESKRCLEEIINMLPLLTEADTEKLGEALSNPNTYRKL